MPAKAPCKKCGYPEKKKGHPTSCLECWIQDQPTDVQIEEAMKRGSFIPSSQRVARFPKEAWPAGRRWCSGCQTFVRLDDCPKGQARCLACTRRAAHGSAIEDKYGLTEAEYLTLLRRQGGVCFLCGRKPVNRRLAVDHDHVTGRVRGLICGGTDWSCNMIVLGTIEGISVDGALNMAKRIVRYFERPPADELWPEGRRGRL